MGEEKLQGFHQSLLANPNIKGIPADYGKFSTVFDDPAKGEAFYKSLKESKFITGLPDNYPDFVNGLAIKAGGIKAPAGNEIPGWEDKNILQKAGAGIKKGWLQTKSGIGALVAEVAPGLVASSPLKASINPGAVFEWADDIKQKAVENKAKSEAIQGKGIVFEAGQFVPQMAGTVGALMAAPVTGGTSLSAIPALIGGANLALMSSQVLGNTLLEVEDYAVKNNKPINDFTKWSVALLAGTAEFAAEKIRLDRILPKGMTSKLLTTILKDKPGVAEDLMKGWAKKNPAMFQKFMQLAKTTTQQGFEEGTEEFFTQIAQDYANYLYQNPDDRLNLKEILGNSAEAFRGGALMGSFLGPITTGSKAAERALRQKKTGITLVQDQGNNTYELIGIKDKTAFVQDQLMNQKEISVDDIKDKITVSKAQMDEYLDAYKNSQDLLPQLEAKARQANPSVLSQEDKDIMQIRDIGQKLRFNGSDNIVFATDGELEGKQPFAILKETEDPLTGKKLAVVVDMNKLKAKLKAANLDVTKVTTKFFPGDQLTERKEMPAQEWIDNEINNYNIVNQQAGKMNAQQTAPVQEGETITLGEKLFNVTTVDQNGVVLNEIKQGNISPAVLVVTPDQYEKVFGKPVAPDAVLPTEGIQDGGNVTQNEAATAINEGIQQEAPPQLPINKQGEIEYEKITEPKAYAYGLQQEFGEDAGTVLDELIAEKIQALEKAKKASNAIERARKVKALGAEITRLGEVKNILKPQTNAETNREGNQPVASEGAPEMVRQEGETSDLRNNEPEGATGQQKEIEQPSVEQTEAQASPAPDETAPVEAKMQKAGEVEPSEEELKANAEMAARMNEESLNEAENGEQGMTEAENAFIENQPITKPSPEVQLIKANAEADANPSEAQKEAGNAKKGHMSWKGMEITIENAPMSVRSGKDKSGKEWSQIMHNPYGYIRRTLGPETEGKDQVDIFMGDNLESDKVFVIDQVDPKTGLFDEPKVMGAFSSVDEARNAYLSNYEPGWKGLGAITEMPLDEFKTWVYDRRKTSKPVDNNIKTKEANEPKAETTNQEADERTDQPAVRAVEQVTDTGESAEDKEIKINEVRFFPSSSLNGKKVTISTTNAVTGDVSKESFNALSLQKDLKKRHRLLQLLQNCVG